jgi:hypothetical protein
MGMDTRQGHRVDARDGREADLCRHVPGERVSPAAVAPQCAPSLARAQGRTGGFADNGRFRSRASHYAPRVPADLSDTRADQPDLPSGLLDAAFRDAAASACARHHPPEGDA